MYKADGTILDVKPVIPYQDRKIVLHFSIKNNKSGLIKI